jgi:uroporphyrinogen-III synthase
MSGQSANPAATPVLVTRPAPQADRFSAGLVAAFGRLVRPVIAPLMQVEHLTPDLPEQSFTALILTSETAAARAGALMKTSLILPKLAYCVGDRTAEAARESGFDARSAAGAADDLVALILSRPDDGPLLWLRGRDVATDIALALTAAGRSVTSAAVYAQTAVPLSSAALELLARTGLLVVPVFSPRSARLLAAAIPANAKATILPVAISARARAALPAGLRSAAVLADAPDAPAMIRAIGRVISSRVP